MAGIVKGGGTSEVGESTEGVKIWKALLPAIRSEIRKQTKNCVRAKKMNVVTAPDPQTKTIGVQEAFGTSAVNIPYSSALSDVAVGTSVWVYWFYGDASTMIAMHAGSGS